MWGCGGLVVAGWWWQGGAGIGEHGGWAHAVRQPPAGALGREGGWRMDTPKQNPRTAPPLSCPAGRTPPAPGAPSPARLPFRLGAMPGSDQSGTRRARKCRLRRGGRGEHFRGTVAFLLQLLVALVASWRLELTCGATGTSGSLPATGTCVERGYARVDKRLEVVHGCLPRGPVGGAVARVAPAQLPAALRAAVRTAGMHEIMGKHSSTASSGDGKRRGWQARAQPSVQHRAEATACGDACARTLTTRLIPRAGASSARGMAEGLRAGPGAAAAGSPVSIGVGPSAAAIAGRPAAPPPVATTPAAVRRARLREGGACGRARSAGCVAPATCLGTRRACATGQREATGAQARITRALQTSSQGRYNSERTPDDAADSPLVADHSACWPHTQHASRCSFAAPRRSRVAEYTSSVNSIN